MNISVIGAGYVGLVTGVCFSEMGHNVTIFDVDEDKISGLKNNVVPFFEPQLHELVEKNANDGRLVFTLDVNAAIENIELIFICVGTPARKDGSADLTFLINATDTILSSPHRTPTLVIKSTVPVGTAQWLCNYAKENYKKNVIVLSNPEFLKEGSAVDDCLRPDRVVIGGPPEACKVLIDLYSTFVRTGRPVLIMDNNSAEAAKYASNGMLAARISYMNELAQICEACGADVEMVRKSMGADDRIGQRFLFAGVGYGGSCFPKDVLALSALAQQRGVDTPLLTAVHNVNVSQRVFFARKIIDYYNVALAGKKVAIWGLSFKPRTDDIRESPALTVIRVLLQWGADIHVYDPKALKNAESVLQDSVKYHTDMYTCCEGASCIVVFTEWETFRNPDFQRLNTLLKAKVIFDGRNIYDPDQMAALGYTYISVGRKPVV